MNYIELSKWLKNTCNEIIKERKTIGQTMYGIGYNIKPITDSNVMFDLAKKILNNKSLKEHFLNEDDNNAIKKENRKKEMSRMSYLEE